MLLYTIYIYIYGIFQSRYTYLSYVSYISVYIQIRVTGCAGARILSSFFLYLCTRVLLRVTRYNMYVCTYETHWVTDAQEREREREKKREEHYCRCREYQCARYCAFMKVVNYKIANCTCFNPPPPLLLPLSQLFFPKKNFSVHV